MPGPHNGGPHSGPYRSQHPNPTEDERYRQAGEILGRLGKGESAVAIAREMRIARSTLYERVALINGQIPDVDLARMIHFERLETMFASVQARLDGEISNADYFRGVAEQRQVLARQSALLRVETPEAAPEAEVPLDPGVRAVLDSFEREGRDDHRGTR